MSHGLATLLLCTYVQAAQVFHDEMMLIDVVTTAFKIDNVHLKISTPNSGLTEDDQLLAHKLAATDAIAFNFLEDRIRNSLEGYRNVIVNGNDHLPPLDPLLIPAIGPYVVEVATGIHADFIMRNFHMDGLRWFVLDHVTFNPIRLTFGLQITLPWLTLTGNYEAEAKVGPLVVHQASGNYRLFINRFEVSVDLRLGANLLGGHLLLRELDIKLNVHDVNIRVGGMVGSTLINAFLNNLVQRITQNFVQNGMENLSQMVSQELFDVVNELLKDYTLADILG